MEQTFSNSLRNGDGMSESNPYDVTADSYDQLYYEEQLAKYRVALSKIRLEENDRILDAGCGTCLLYEYLINERSSFNYYVGLDLSKGMIEKCLEKKTHIDARVDLVLGDIRRPPLREHVFTKIFVFTVLDIVGVERGLESLLNLLGRGIIVYTLLKHKGCKPGIEEGVEVKDCVYMFTA